MADNILSVALEISADPSKAIAAGRNLTAGLDRMANAGEIATARMSSGFGQTHADMIKAHGAALVFERELGVHLPRSFQTLIAHSETLGPLLSAAFPVAGLLLFAGQIPHLIDKIKDLASSLGGYDEAAKKAFADAVKASDDALTKFKDVETGQKLLIDSARHLADVNKEVAQNTETFGSRLEQNLAKLGLFGFAMGTAAWSTRSLGEAQKDAAKTQELLNEQSKREAELQIQVAHGHLEVAKAREAARLVGKEHSAQLRSELHLLGLEEQLALKQAIGNDDKRVEIEQTYAAKRLRLEKELTEALRQEYVRRFQLEQQIEQGARDWQAKMLQSTVDFAKQAEDQWNEIENKKREDAAITTRLLLKQAAEYNEKIVENQRRAEELTKQIAREREAVEVQSLRNIGSAVEGLGGIYGRVFGIISTIIREKMLLEKLAALEAKAAAANEASGKIAAQAGEAKVSAAHHLAKGFGALAHLDFAGAARHFLASAKFLAVVGMAAGTIASLASLGGGGGGSEAAGAGGGGAGSGAARAAGESRQGETPVTNIININGFVGQIDSESVRKLMRAMNIETVKSRQPLYATTAFAPIQNLS